MAGTNRNYMRQGARAGWARIAVLTAVAAGCGVAAAQMHPLASRSEPVAADSGLQSNPGTDSVVAWSRAITVADATWLRLGFATAVLGENADTHERSYLRITSLLDGEIQTLDARGVRQWRQTSAYFNGDSVWVELVVAPDSGENRVVIREATAGIAEEGGVATICGPTDDRALSSDPRAGRLLPVGCSGWIIDDANHCMLTAGHCAGSSLQVLEFNVPLSTSGGAVVHPGPQDQYPVDPASVQATSGGVGLDWCYFGCFANTQTGLTAVQAQGAWFELATPPAVAGQNIRVTGYGTVSSPVSPTWNQVQKTHVGPYVTNSGSTLQYATDTTGGNSGSPVIDETTGAAIGIHTHGGCTSTSGQNSGTGSNNSGLQNALANPLGVCRSGLEFAYPNGRPTMFADRGTTTVRVTVAAFGGNDPQPGTGHMHVDAGGGFVDTPMTEVSPNVYDAVFPSVACGATVRYYFSAEATSATRFFDPLSAPAAYFSAAGGAGEAVAFSDDFQTDKGWTVMNENLTDGPWERAIPSAGGLRGDPVSDYDGSGFCYVTDNAAGNSDVDGGPTRLISPTIDLSAPESYELHYARWFTTDTGEDRLTVEISANGGGSWTLIESVTPATGWVAKSWSVGDFIAPSATVKLRFSVADNPNGSITEAGIDAVRVARVECSPSLPAGDTNCDGTLNQFDITPFVLALGDPAAYQAAYPDCFVSQADMNADGTVNQFDIQGFVDALIGP